MGNQLNTNQIKNGHIENNELDLMNTNKPETLYNIKRKNKDQISLNLLTDLNPDDNLEMVIKSRKIQPIHKKQFSHVDVINQKNPIPSPFYQSNQQIRFDDELKVNSSVISQVNNSSIDDYKLNEFLQVIKNDAQQDFQKLEELENNENNKNDQTNNQTKFLENQKSFKQDQTIQNQQEQENEDQQQKEFKQIEIAPLRKKNYFASNNYELIINQHNQQNKQQITDEETLFKLIQNNKPISEFVSGNQRQIIKNIMIKFVFK
ncbi:hypothetical protein PPERSA_09051 [Pseudocohnilembus persalinus]|uniref:Uncharacterized protein n=1 Tax=Pseudocohnilembus persalinus TaxID=266149 RepID=A0A0V0QLJ1_PSEPJ|nr:hypothetical protein PPERSA_09051 [Pseudocohnilembus persalinus]|eukprot:KRX02929.1 hypothetical protein PPERSA_09051 [Pseudocohnilembus persalinus]